MGAIDLSWREGAARVLSDVFAERERQVARYGFNENVLDGTGPNVRWLLPIDYATATVIEENFRVEYEAHERATGLPTWVHLVREEVAEAFKEDDPARLEAELIQVAALCVSWVERLRAREGTP